jgi:hypothetical protein
LHDFSDWGLIKSHSKGLPPRTTYRAWRLTTRGVDAVGSVFPNENIPDGVVDRTAEQSLYNLDHREAAARLYLGLITQGVEPANDNEAAPRVLLDRRMAQVARHAGEVAWQADGDVVLSYSRLGTKNAVVPDATATSPARRVRIFIEVDRSTKALARIRDNLERYHGYFVGAYADAFPDRYKPWILYVVGSDARRANIAKLARDRLAPTLGFMACQPSEAMSWLEFNLLTPARHS